MQRSNLTGALQGIRFCFCAGSEELHRYAEAHLGPVLDSNQDSTSTVRVASTLRWVNGQPWPRARWGDAVRQWPRVDRDLYINERELLWFRVDDLRDLVLHLRVPRGGALTLDGTFFFRLGNRALTDRLRRWWLGRRTQDFERRRFPTLLSYLVYYPVWWIGELECGRHPFHAAAVATPEGAILLAGASGVGKSTISTAVAAHAGNKLLSDSFVLFDGKRVLAVPEPILLDGAALRWLGSKGEILRRVDHRYMLQRFGYHVVPEKLQLEAVPAVVVFPRRGLNWCCRRISPEEAWFRLSAVNLMVNDLRRYYALAAAWEYLEPQGLVARREKAAAKLTNSVPAFEIEVPAHVQSDVIVGRLMDLVGAARKSVEGYD